MRVHIIHFSSPTCTICTSQDRVLQELHSTDGIAYESRLITTNFSDALTYGVKSAPTLVYLLDQKAVAVKPGFQSREKILDQIEQII